MYEIIRSDEFLMWVENLNDKRAIARISARIDRASAGNLGDHKYLREGVSEMRIDFGPGYRIYFTRIGKTIVVMLGGGDKKKQDDDINRAVELAKLWRQ